MQNPITRCTYDSNPKLHKKFKPRTMTENQPDSEPRLDRVGIHPNLLIRSFFLVVACYMLFFVLFTAVGFGLALILDGSEFIEKLQPENYDRAGGADFETLFSKTWSWIMLAFGAGLAFGVGFLVSRFANFSNFGHGVMLAILFLVTLLNTFFNNADAAPFFFRLTMLGFIPIGTLFGAKYSEIRQLEKLHADEETTDSVEG